VPPGTVQRNRPPMSLSLIQIILGSSFVLIWLFIAAMIFRDGRFAIRDEEESAVFRADAGHRRPRGPYASLERQKCNERARRQTSAA
jgi:hypothetical protein